MAVTREDPPRLIIAANDEVLSRALVTQIIAQEDPKSFKPRELGAIRTALLEERWSDAVAIWIDTTSASVDVYPDEEVLTEEDLSRDAAAFSMRLGRIFSEAGND